MKKKLLLIPLVIVITLSSACGKVNPPSQTTNQSNTATQGTQASSSSNPSATATATGSATSTSSPGEQKGLIVNALKEYTTAQFRKDVDALAARYGNIIKTENLGKTTKGNDIILLKLGRGDNKVLMVGEIHAREHITASFLMKVIEEYASVYTNNTKYGEYDVKKILDENTIYFVPVANPDGLDIVTNNTKPNLTIADYDKFWSTWKSNGNGVDLNSNFPYYWDQIKIGSDKPRKELYKGPSAGSENETKVLMTLCKSNSFGFMLTFHTKGRVIYWRDEGSGVLPGDEKLANTISNLTGYVKQPSTQLPETDTGGGYAGGFENWFRFELKKPGICVEMVKGGTGNEPYKNTEFEKEDVMNWDKTKYLVLEVLVK